MKKIALAFVALLLSASAMAWTIGPMNYQGRLLDNAGIPATGSYTFNVRIYDALTGGTLKFAEQHNNIAVDDGVYSFLVSTGSTLSGTWDINLWNTPSLYLEIEVNGQTLTPRHLLASTPFAFQANLALTTNNALALGGKSAAQYNSVLGAICESSKGKWLELVQQCLGAGSSFPGPVMVNLNTLTASTTLTDLDLSRADISGIDFGTANLSGTNFDGATINVQGVKNANLSDTTLTNIITSGGNVVITANLANAKIGNVSLAAWSMSGATLTGTSMADLSACPSSLPVNYFCEDHKSPSNGKKLVAGPGVNFSETSLLKNRIRTAELDNYLIGWTRNLSGADFSGNKIEGPYPIFQQTDLSGGNFRNTNIRQTSFSGSLDGANFSNSSINNVGFYSTMVGTDFTAADLSYVTFYPGSGASISFDYANLVYPIFGDGPTNLSIHFGYSSLTSPAFAAGFTSLNFDEGVKIFGGLYLGAQVAYAYFFETYFSGGNISGNFAGAEFASTSEFFNVSFNGANFTGVHNMATSDYVGVNWYGATCPDGFQVTTLGGTCVGHFLP